MISRWASKQAVRQRTAAGLGGGGSSGFVQRPRQARVQRSEARLHVLPHCLLRNLRAPDTHLRCMSDLTCMTRL